MTTTNPDTPGGTSNYPRPQAPTSHTSPSDELRLSGGGANTLRAPEDTISLQHHMATWKEVLDLVGADQAIFFDDVINAVDEAQQAVFSGLPGYMRCCLPAAQIAAFIPAHVVTLTPPLPYEIQHSLDSLERMGGKHENFHIWYKDPQSGERVDLVRLVEQEDWQTYHRLVAYACENPPEFNHTDYPEQVRQIFEETRADHPTTLLLPFQIRELHRQDFSAEIAEGSISTLSPSDLFMNKGKTVNTLIKAVPEVAQYFTTPQPITLARTPVDPSLVDLMTTAAAELSAALPDRTLDVLMESERISLPLSAIAQGLNPSTEKLRVGIVRSLTFIPSAIQYIDACDRIEAGDQNAYIKLNTSGVSGLDNLSPNTHPEIYEGTRAERIGALAVLLANRFGGHDDAHLPTGSVEIRITPGYDHLGKREFSIAGMNLAARYTPLFFGRSITSEGDVHEGMLACSDGQKIGMSATEIAKLVEMQELLAEAERLSGYELGELQNDCMFDNETGKLSTYDFNNRRGGRSYIERLVALYPDTVFFDQDFSFTVPQDTTVHDFAIELTRKAEELGLHSYGTPTIYYPERDEHGNLHVKLKLVSPVPEELLELCQHYEHALPQLMEHHIRKLLGQENNMH